MTGGDVGLWHRGRKIVNLQSAINAFSMASIKSERDRKNIICLFIVEMIIMIPKMIISMKAMPVVDIRDEVAMLKVPAYIAGFDWSKSTGDASYYGFGYYFLFFPLFMIKMDIISLYRFILIITSLIECIIPAIIFRILDNFSQEFKCLDKVLIVLYLSFVTVNPPYNLINEHVLYVLIWITILLICNLIGHKNKRRDSILLGAVLLYAQTIHTRAIILIFAVLISVAVVRFIYKEWIVDKMFWLILTLGYPGTKFFIKVVQNVIWGNQTLANSSIPIPHRIHFFREMEGFFKIILGNLGTSLIFLKSFLGMMLVSLWLYVGKALKRRDHVSGECRRQGEMSFSIFLISFLCIAITLGGLGLSNMSGVTEAIEERNANAYALKTLTYLRYYLCYTPPLLMLGIIVFLKEPMYFRRALIVGSGVTVVVLWAWYCIIVPNIKDNYFGISSFYPFSWMIGKGRLDRLNEEDYTKIVLITFDLFIFLLCSVNKSRRKYAYLIISTVLLFYQFLYFQPQYSSGAAAAQYEEVKYSLELMRQMEEEEKDIVVYVYDDKGRIPYLIQLYNYDMEIISGLPQEDETGILIISNCELIDRLGEGYSEQKINDNQYIYMR